MAPRMSRDYHSIGGPDRYPLRTTRHSENNVLTVHRIDTSQINGKEDFFRCMGLQMKRSQHRYKMFSDNFGTKVVNIPLGVTLRDCSVVVLGTRCKICGKCFKCETDVNVHTKLKHLFYLKNNTSTDTKETHCTKYGNEMYEIFSDPFERGTIRTRKDSDFKLHKRLQLILKIGEEVVTKIFVKRKHLKMNTSTQTESNGITKLIVDKEGYENNVPDIDPPLSRNSLCKCYNPTLHAVNSTNQYLVSNIIIGKENTTSGRNFALNKLTESRMICCKNCNSTRIPPTTLNNLSMPDKESYNFVEPCLKLSSNSAGEDPDLTLVTNDTNIISKDDNKNKNQRDVNANETLIDISPEKQSRNTTTLTLEDSVVPQLSLDSPHQPSVYRRRSTPPQVLPIAQQQLTSSKQLSTPEKQLTSVQQPSTPPQQTPACQLPSILQYLVPLPQSSTPSQEQIAPINNSTDDEIQEVLRIIRGYNNSNTEINHESPNRYEQELLLRDVIEDMKKMEERGLHLLGKMSAKKRKRAPRKSNPKNGGANNESTKKRKKSAAQTNAEHNIENSMKKRCTSSTKEQATKTQSQNNVCVEDILKENLGTCNANFNNTCDMLRGYGINFFNDVLEINNNTENIQEPVGCFLAPCSGGMENRSSRPIVIDLVNDTDE